MAFDLIIRNGTLVTSADSRVADVGINGGLIAAIEPAGTLAAAGEAIEGGIVASQGLAAQEQIDYSRSVEEEADRVGIEYLAAAGFDPEAMGDIFQKMMRLQGIQASWVPAGPGPPPPRRPRGAVGGPSGARPAPSPARRAGRQAEC